MYMTDTNFGIKEEKRTFSRIGAAFALLIVVTIGAQYLLLAVMSLAGIHIRELSSDLQIILSAMPMYMVAVPVSVALLWRVPAHYKPADHRLKPSWMIIGFMICISTMYIGNIIGQLLMFLFQTARNKEMGNQLTDLVLNSNLWINFLVIAVAAPIIEELLFRKLLIDRINRYGQGISVLVSGLTFGLIHGNFYQFFYAFGLGVIFAYIYVKTGRIRYTIAYHMVINFLGAVLAVWLARATTGLAAIPSAPAMQALLEVWPIMVLGIYGMVMLACFIAGIVLAICYRKQLTFHSGVIVIPRGLRFRTIFLNVGMLAFLCTCALQFAMTLLGEF